MRQNNAHNNYRGEQRYAYYNEAPVLGAVPEETSCCGLDPVHDADGLVVFRGVILNILVKFRFIEIRMAMRANSISIFYFSSAKWTIFHMSAPFCSLRKLLIRDVSFEL